MLSSKFSSPTSRAVVVVFGLGVVGVSYYVYKHLTRKKQVGSEKKTTSMEIENYDDQKPKTSTFGSVGNSDKKIVEQLRNRNYQLPLDSHDWPDLIPLGPDFVSLADNMYKLWTEDGETSENVKPQILFKYIEPILKNQGLDDWLYQFLISNPHILFQAIKEISESYLTRAPEGTKEKNPPVPQIPLLGTNKNNFGNLRTYTPKAYLASGNASKVWLGTVPLESGIEKEVVLKQINETQKDSAIIEYMIAQKLLYECGENSRNLMHYMDLIYQSPTKIWLVLEKIRSTKFGLDLTQYLSNNFFQTPGEEYRYHGRRIVIDLLLGLRHIAYSRVILRDLKADNVLINFEPTTNTFQAKWTDFGLAVDLDDIRRPRKGNNQDQVLVGLIGFWYDTQKLVPRPKWTRRRPPENCFKICDKNLASYDIYMLGVVFCSMATGIDWAHIEKKEILQKAETIFGVGFAGNTESEVLKWDIGKSVNGPLRSNFQVCFKDSFGALFGEKLFEHTLGMLEADWNLRPTPEQVYEDISKYHT